MQASLIPANSSPLSIRVKSWSLCRASRHPVLPVTVPSFYLLSLCLCLLIKHPLSLSRIFWSRRILCNHTNSQAPCDRTSASLPNSCPTSALLTWCQSFCPSLPPLKTSGLLLPQDICSSWMAQPPDLCMVCYFLSFRTQMSPPQRYLYWSPHLKWPTHPAQYYFTSFYLLCPISQSEIVLLFIYVYCLSPSSRI